ncbi:unnamed protein product [Camellia sinensis]
MRNNQLTGSLNVLANLPLTDLNVANNHFSRYDGNSFDNGPAPPSPPYTSPPPGRPHNNRSHSPPGADSPQGSGGQSSNPDNGNKKALAAGLIIGIALGSSLVVFFAMLVIVFCLRKGKRKEPTAARTSSGSLLVSTDKGVFSATFTIVNQCSYTVWPGILSGAGTPPLSSTGFALQTGESTAIPVPTAWSGRLWGRTFCTTDSTTGKFTCATGDCGSSTIQCSGSGGAPPATLAEFTLNGAGGLDFYDVSLVDGYNLPMLVVPQGGTGGGNCTATGCVVDLNGSCPSELRVLSDGGAENVACKSACDAFGDPQHCCSGAYATPDTCKPTYFSEYFKSACPRAYSYAYDDGSSTFTCASADYVITFCPTPATRSKIIWKPTKPGGNHRLLGLKRKQFNMHSILVHHRLHRHFSNSLAVVVVAVSVSVSVSDLAVSPIHLPLGY